MTFARPQGPFRRIGCGASVAACSILVALAGVEIALRLFWPQALLHDPDAFVPDPVLGARLRPGFTDRVVTTEFSSDWRINADGYRGPVAGASGLPALRIVALGDSFTFGYGVEESQAWPAVLDRLFNVGADPVRRIEVVNLGVGGYGTWQEALWLEEKLPALHPDLALLAFYVGNDPADNARTAPAQGGPPAEAGQRGAGGAERLKRWLGSRLHLYALVSMRADELLVRLGLRRLVYPFEVEVLREPEPPDVGRAWEATRQAMVKFADVARTGGARPLVVIVPMKHQVSEGVWIRLVRFYAEGSDGGYDRDRPQRVLAAICEDLGIETLDLLPGLRAAAAAAGEDGRDYYWPRDQHFNTRGHAEAARLIAERLRSLDGFEEPGSR